MALTLRTNHNNDDSNWDNTYLVVPLFIIFLICSITSVAYGEYRTIPFILIIFIVILRILFNNKLKIKKLKRYKKIGLGTVKLVKVTGIKTLYEKSYCSYYLESKDGDQSYYSIAYVAGKIGGISKELMEEIYRKYGFEFDEKETHKQDVLAECNRCIEEKKYELENEGFLKRILTNYQIMLMKDQKDIVKKGYQPAYWEVNGHRITVGDTVTVYIDPENPKYYWMDIDFLFEK